MTFGAFAWDGLDARDSFPFLNVCCSVGSLLEATQSQIKCLSWHTMMPLASRSSAASCISVFTNVAWFATFYVHGYNWTSFSQLGRRLAQRHEHFIDQLSGLSDGQKSKTRTGVHKRRESMDDCTKMTKMERGAERIKNLRPKIQMAMRVFG